MSRIFICADSRFPKADAGANRIQYLSRALMEAGHDVLVLACGKATPDGYAQYAGVRYKNVIPSQNKLVRMLEKKLLDGRRVCALLKAEKPGAKDVVLIYGSNSIFVSPLVKYCRRQKITAFIDVVEWHQPFQYRFGRWDVRYIGNKHTFEKLAVDTGHVMAISGLIQQFYLARGCRSEVFPIMIDSTEHADYAGRPAGSDVIHFIYPGNPEHKDDFRTMILGIAGLPEELQHRMVFHVTGAKEATLRSLLGEDQQLLDTLKHCVQIHGWMEYEDLISLYRQCDFLYMSRPDNRVTQANFPSKMPELMAYGILPMGTKVGDYINYLRDGVDSLLIEENTPAACTAALRRALALEPAELDQMRAAAQKAARENFDYRRWVSRLADFVKADE